MVTCQHAGANVITLTLAAASGGSLQVGDQSGSPVSVPVTVGEGQAAVVKATAGADYWIRCLPHDFPTLQVSKPGNPPDGYYLTGNATGSPTTGSGTYAMILDPHGTPGEVEIFGRWVGGRVAAEPLYDARGERVRA